MQAITKVFSDIVKPYIDATDNGLINNDFANGAVNILPNTASSATVNGITFTVNSDGTVTANGTATAEVRKVIHFFAQDEYVNSISKLYLSGCPSNGSNTTYMLYAMIKKRSDDSYVAERQDIGSGKLVEYDNVNNYIRSITIAIAEGQTVSNLTFKPMITVADLPNSDYAHYVPYAMTNQQLTQETIGLIDNQNIDGCKNHFRMPWSDFVSNGVTWQVNENGIITANGTVTQSPSYSSNPTETITGLVVGETYVLSGLPESTTLSGGSNAKAYIKLYKNDGSYVEINTGAVSKILIFTYDGTNARSIDIGIRAVGTVVTNAVFKPMICLKSLYDADSTFAPYAKSNKELTETLTVSKGAPTANTGYIASSDLHYEKYGKVVHVFGNFETNTAILGTDSLVTLFTNLPNSNGGMNGASSQYTLCLLHDNTNDGLSYRCFVSNEGKLVSRYKAIPIGTYFADFTYICQ